MKEILSFLSYNVETRPQTLGLYHFCWLVGIVLFTILFSRYFRNASEKQNRNILLVFWLIIVAFEIYKEVVFSYDIRDGAVVWNYQWYAFPFQFCSSPFYILPIAIFVKQKLINDIATSFLAFYSLLAGAIVFIYPGSVFETSIAGVLVQTMVHHGLMIVLGVYLIVRNRQKLSLKYFAKGSIAFCFLVAVAFVLNEVVPLYIDDVFNMFFISRKYPCTLVILDGIYASVPYVVFLIIYIASFAFGAFLMFGIGKLCSVLTEKSKNIKSRKAV